MKLTKRQLKQRLKDMAAGAGMPWCTDGYWENEEDPIVNLNRFANAILGAFYADRDDFPVFLRLGLGWVECFTELDKLTEQVWSDIGEN